jgi:hypothetical protein
VGVFRRKAPRAKYLHEKFATCLGWCRAVCGGKLMEKSRNVKRKLVFGIEGREGKKEEAFKPYLDVGGKRTEALRKHAKEW